MDPKSPSPVPFAEAVRVWARIAALSFGGPAGQIAVMHRILVEEKRWLGERRFLHALNFCMLLPGPEAQQLAIYIGWLMHRTLGGVVAGVLFVLPGLVAVMALSLAYVVLGRTEPAAALLLGIKAAVLVMVLQALVRIGRRALRGPAQLALAGAAFLAIFAFDLPFPLIVAAAAAIGFVAGRTGLKGFDGGGHGPSGAADPEEATALGETLPTHARPGWAWTLKVAAVVLLLWVGPTAALLIGLGPENVFSRIALFFSQMAVVTFGGAYAVLSYVAQAAVDTYGWLEPGEMLDGLGMAEATPGPLIIVTQFVGFMGAFRDPGGLPPLVAGVMGGLLTTWVTFTPCFLWIFVGAPFAEALRGARGLAGALSGVTAAVVGVVLNLAVWFGLHVLFGVVVEATFGPVRLDLPYLDTLDPAAALLVAAAAISAFLLRAGLAPLLIGGAVAGLALHGARLLGAPV